MLRRSFSDNLNQFVRFNVAGKIAPLARYFDQLAQPAAAAHLSLYRIFPLLHLPKNLNNVGRRAEYAHKEWFC
jgi:hypothetical protein